ncbi:bulb-type lectin domain-containing protein [Tanacetum coccineum]
MKTPFVAYLFLASFLLLFCYPVIAQPFDYPTANLSTTWTNNVSAPHSVSFTDGSTVRAILLRGSFGPKFACGFYCNGTCTSYLFAVFIVQTNSGSGIVQPAIGFPQVVWSANRERPVKLGAKLELDASGDLVLKDADGSQVWSTKTAGKSVAGMQITDTGNLVLFNANNAVVWQSYDHQTDSLVPGQKLVQGQKLIASVSSTNWGKGLYSLEVTNNGLVGYVGSNPRRVYYRYLVNGSDRSKERSYVRFLNGSLSLFIHTSEPSRPDGVIRVPFASSAQYMKLMPDGSLKVFEWLSGWKVVADLLGSRR